VKRLGVIGSSGGSALSAADHCLKMAGHNVEWTIVTDRKCGLEKWAISSGHKTHRISYTDPEAFSLRANEIFKNSECDDILLFFTKRVSYPLIKECSVANIHPALLPGLKGLNVVRKSVSARARIIGTTLHQVNEELDEGAIIAQIATPIGSADTYKQAEYISYLHKIWLTLLWYDSLFNKTTTAPMSFSLGSTSIPAIASPGISDSNLINIFLTDLRNQITD
jgi:phosphoribosylglycinamide formyltransferase 1